MVVCIYNDGAEHVRAFPLNIRCHLCCMTHLRIFGDVDAIRPSPA